MSIANNNSNTDPEELQQAVRTTSAANRNDMKVKVLNILQKLICINGIVFNLGYGFK
jgi:hypothetical protein